MKSVCLDLRQPLSLPYQRPSPSRAWFMVVLAAPAPSVGSMVHCHIVVGVVHIFLTGPAAPSVPSIIHGGLVTPVVTKSAAPSVPSMVHGGRGTPCLYNTGSAALYRPSRPGPCPGSVLRVHGALSHWCRGSPYLPYRISGSVRPIHIPKSSMAGGQLNRYGSS